MDQIWKVEEIRARQSSRHREIKEGGRNTSYFFAKANQRKRKKNITSLEEDGMVYEDNGKMLKHATTFYKRLFGGGTKRKDSSGWRLLKRVWKSYPWRKSNFGKWDNWRRDKRAIDGSYSDGALGPDGFSFLFYQKFWETIKGDFMPLVKEFEKGKVNMARLNFAMIILIPKEDESKTLKKFRPISLIKCSFKFFAKTLNNRLEVICNRLLAPNQTDFVKGRFILESVVPTHEIIHKVVKSKEKGVILKLDYEKAYDRVRCQFLEEMLVSRCFGSKWIAWVLSMVKGGSISIRINDENSAYFKPGKGLR
jgi:hypothetical protein